MDTSNDAKTDINQPEPIEPVALLDCGQASKVTKGVPFMLYFELASPPYDRALVY